MSDQLKQQQSLKQKWKNFGNVIFDPWVVFLLIFTIILYILFSNINTGDKGNKTIITVITTIISIITGLLGGVIANKWAELTEIKVMVARGKSAIRGLKLILLNVANIEKRTKEYIGNISEENSEYKLIRSTYEEVIEKCNIVEEEIISAIENWTDILPEAANFKTEIGLVSNLKQHQVALGCEIDKLNEDIKNLQQSESDEKEKLQEKLKQKEEELSNTRKKLRDKENELNKSIFSGITSAPMTIGTSSFGAQNTYSKCRKCGTFFLNDSQFFQDKCPNCRNSFINIVNKEKK